MRLFSLFACAFATLSAVNAVSIHDPKALSPCDSCSSANILGDGILSPANAREKRKGGGGKSGGGGAKVEEENRPKTVSGSGVRPAYGGGRYYGGGATVPYTAGQRSPLGLAPLLIPPIAALAIFPGLWLYGVYQYPYTHPYMFVNETVTNATFPSDGELKTLRHEVVKRNTALIKSIFNELATEWWKNGGTANSKTVPARLSLCILKQTPYAYGLESNQIN